MSLRGLTVLVTRPKPQGEVLCDNIREAGGEAIYFPMITILPPENTDTLDQDIAKLDHCDILIVVSPQVVYQVAEKIHAIWPILPSHLKIIAVGLGTAEALATANLPVHAYPENDWHSEGVLELPLLKNVVNKKIAVLRGDTGRELINDVLAQRGASLVNMVAYRRVISTANAEPYKELLHSNKIHIIICTSNEIVQNVATLLGVQAVPLLVISERMLAFANKLGFMHCLLAKNATHDAIMSVLVKQKDQLCQMKRIKS